MVAEFFYHLKVLVIVEDVVKLDYVFMVDLAQDADLKGNLAVVTEGNQLGLQQLLVDKLCHELREKKISMYSTYS